LEDKKFKANLSYIDSNENKGNEDSIFLTIDFAKSLSIVITPICIKIIQEFVEALDYDVKITNYIYKYFKIIKI